MNNIKEGIKQDLYTELSDNLYNNSQENGMFVQDDCIYRIIGVIWI